jgi:UPF0716 protein FxsA
MVLTSFAGGLVLRHAGRGQLARFGVAMRDSKVTEAATGGGGFMVVLGGILLLLPGFITDLIGAGLLIAPVRHRLGATIGRAINPGQRQPPGSGSVIDLAPTEWRQVPDPKLRKRRRPQ